MDEAGLWCGESAAQTPQRPLAGVGGPRAERGQPSRAPLTLTWGLSASSELKEGLQKEEREPPVPTCTSLALNTCSHCSVSVLNLRRKAGGRQDAGSKRSLGGLFDFPPKWSDPLAFGLSFALFLVPLLKHVYSLVCIRVCLRTVESLGREVGVGAGGTQPRCGRLRQALHYPVSSLPRPWKKENLSNCPQPHRRSPPEPGFRLGISTPKPRPK